MTGVCLHADPKWQPAPKRGQTFPDFTVSGTTGRAASTAHSSPTTCAKVARGAGSAGAMRTLRSAFARTSGERREAMSIWDSFGRSWSVSRTEQSSAFQTLDTETALGGSSGSVTAFGSTVISPQTRDMSFISMIGRTGLDILKFAYAQSDRAQDVQSTLIHIFIAKKSIFHFPKILGKIRRNRAASFANRESVLVESEYAQEANVKKSTNISTFISSLDALILDASKL